MTTTQEHTTDDTREIRALHSASLTGESVPGRVLVAPWGQVESTNGSFVVDEESARLAARSFEEHGTDIPIDYEHQTLGGTYSSPNGQAPAAGWIKRLDAEPGVGLVAVIEWVDHAKEMLASKEYRYLSPVAIIRKTDRKLIAIHSAALTNKPAIRGMQPIVNRVEATSGETTVEPMARLREELNLGPDVAAEEVLVAASRRLIDLEREARRRHVEQRVLEAMRTGKLVEAQRTWAESMVASEEELFDEWLRTAPVIVSTGASNPPTASEAGENWRGSVVARAKSEFRSVPLLSRLTTEEAYVANALREARIGVSEGGRYVFNV